MAGKKKVTQNEESKEKEVQVTKLVKMVRGDGKTADVHPLEVENYKSGGFQVVQ